MSADLETLASSLGPAVRRHHPLGALTTYRVGGTAALFLPVRSEEDLVAVRQALEGRRVPVLVLGKGSNLLVADAGFPGLVLHLEGQCAAIDVPEPQGEAHRGEAHRNGGAAAITVRAGGGAGLPVLARRTVEAGLSGLEWAVGVPGTVGGAVAMNAGGHGSDVASCLRRARWLDLAGPAQGVSGPEHFAFGYRVSSVQPAHVVVWAEFSLVPGDAEQGRQALAEIVRWRREHQPGGSNAGSVFVNPEGDSAGRLVDAAGLKGFRIGSAQVSPKHANFIQADQGGSADDVWRLIGHVRRAVADRFGVELRPEVRLVGFPSDQTGGMDGTRGQA